MSLTPSQKKAADAFLDAVIGPFRRSNISGVLYARVSPRSREAADKLADQYIQEKAKAGLIQRHGHLHWVRVSVTRTLKDGRTVPEESDVCQLTLRTRCSRKWLAVDMETGDIWEGSPDGWNRASKTAQKALAAFVGKTETRS